MTSKLIKKIIPSLAIMLMLVLGVGCNNESEGTAKLRLSLTDAPALDYTAVNIDIKSVQVGVSGDSVNNWVTLNMNNPGVYNLLNYRNGDKVVLADQDFPAGTISQIRFILGPNNSVVKNGVEYPLTVPSGMQSGLKFNLHQNLVADMMYSFVIDFDASKSVVETGNGKFILKPVIRTYAEEYGATLRGFVLPTEAKAFVEIIHDKDTLTSLPAADGKFLFAGIKGGNWDVYFKADATTGYKDSTLLTVPVEEGKIKDLGTINLKK